MPPWSPQPAGDISNPADLERWFRATEQRFSAVDIVVTNTGGPPAARFAQLSEEQRYGRPEEIGEVIAFLCSERASYVTGASIQVDGGLIKSTF